MTWTGLKSKVAVAHAYLGPLDFWLTVGAVVFFALGVPATVLWMIFG